MRCAKQTGYWYCARLDSQPVFQRRFERKQALLQRVADVANRKATCSGQVSNADTDVALTASSFEGLHSRTRALLTSVDYLERLTHQIVDPAIGARSRGWLRADISTMAFPPNSALNLLRQRVDELNGIASLRLRDPHPAADAQLSDYQDALLRLVVEEDAHRFLALLTETAAAADCTAAECLSLLKQTAEQDLEVRAARQDAEDELQQVERTIQAMPGLGVFARDTSAWLS